MTDEMNGAEQKEPRELSEQPTSSGDQPQPFKSGFMKGRDAFLSHVLVKAMELGERTPEDLMRHFPPVKIMLRLKDAPELRAKILVGTTALKEKTALKQTPENAGLLLQDALEGYDTTPADVHRLFHPDDQVRYMDRKDLWAYATEKASSEDKFALSPAYLASILDVALENELITRIEIMNWLGTERFAPALAARPKEDLERIIIATFKDGGIGTFTEEALGCMTPTHLVEHIELAYIWKEVVCEIFAPRHELVTPKTPEQLFVESARDRMKKGESPKA